jgi:hypothetical protein
MDYMYYGQRQRPINTTQKRLRATDETSDISLVDPHKPTIPVVVPLPTNTLSHVFGEIRRPVGTLQGQTGNVQKEKAPKM